MRRFGKVRRLALTLTMTAFLAGSFGGVQEAGAQEIGAVEKNCMTFEAEMLTVPAFTKSENVVSGVRMYWEASQGDPTGYAVYRSLTPSGGFTRIANVTGTSYTDTTAESGTKYYYKLRAVRGSEMSGASAAVSKIFVDTPDITTRENSMYGIRMYWDKVEGATGYAIYRKGDDAGESWSRVKTISGNETFVWTDRSTMGEECNGIVYHYTIRALAGEDMKTLSGCLSNGRTMVRLNKGCIEKVEGDGNYSAQVTWTGNEEATGYEVRFMRKDSVFKTVTVGDPTILTKKVTELKSGSSFKIQVRCYFKTANAGTYYSSWSDAKYYDTNIELPFVPYVEKE